MIWALYLVLREGLSSINPDHLYSFINFSADAKINTSFFGIVDLAKQDRYILPALAGVTQYILTVMTTPVPKEGSFQEKMIARQMTIIFPIMTIFIAAGFPAGLSIYWVATTLFGIGQQLWVNMEKTKDMTVRIKKIDGHEALVVDEETQIEIKDKDEGEKK